MKKLSDASRLMGNVLPKNAEWIKEPVAKVEASENYVVTHTGLKVFYEYLVIAAGLRLDYDKVYLGKNS